MKALLYSLAELLLLVSMVMVVWSDPAPISNWFGAASADEQLLSSSWSGDHEQFDDALTRGASVAARDSSGTTPLHYAAVSGDAVLALRLISMGADVNAANTGGRTPLIYAGMTDRAEVAEILLRHGAKPTDDALDAAIFSVADRTEGVLRRWREMLSENAEP